MALINGQELVYQNTLLLLLGTKNSPFVIEIAPWLMTGSEF